MAKKTTRAAGTYKAGGAAFRPAEAGLEVATSGGAKRWVPWQAVAALAGEKPGPLGPLLARLDADWAKRRPRYLHGLRGPASPDDLAALEKALGRPLPDELRQWLLWHDGQGEDLIGAFVEAFNLMGARQIGEAYRRQSAEPGWAAAWLPLLDDGQDDFVVLDAASPGCAVREWWRGSAEVPVVAPTLEAWLARLLAEVEAGLYHEDPERGEYRLLG